MSKLVSKMQKGRICVDCSKKIVTKAWLAHALKWMEQTVWVEMCSSFKMAVWYRTVVSLHQVSTTLL